MYRFGELSISRMQGIDKNLQAVVQRALRKSFRRHDGNPEATAGSGAGAAR
jgi:hypothetical protein